MDVCTRAQLKRSLGKLRNSQPQAKHTQPMASPCVSMCKMDEARGLCIDCMHTIDETASWSTMDDATHLAVWKTLSEHACAWLNDVPCA